ncbi:hypothetical protein FPV67DRAFT_516617 [Lyophyllum atratum]|nr:hypothetical protein FPV67DRAFT_516617 [Lyophyllum atratum]
MAVCALPEELLHEVLQICLDVDYDAFANRSPNLLRRHRTEVVSLLLVCKNWLRVGTPLTYQVTLLESVKQSQAFARLLRQRKSLGSHVRKLRIEGGCGGSLSFILTSVPQLTHISISLDISSGQNVLGLCAGLERINPVHVVLRDRRHLSNRGVRTVVNALIRCIKGVWSNMTSFDYPYDDYGWDHDSTAREPVALRQRGIDLALTLAHAPHLEVVYVPRAYSLQGNDVVLQVVKNPSVRKIYSWCAWRHDRWGVVFAREVQTHQRLREVVHLPLPGPWARRTYAAVGDRNFSEIETTFRFGHSLNIGPSVWGCHW